MDLGFHRLGGQIEVIKYVYLSKYMGLILANPDNSSAKSHLQFNLQKSWWELGLTDRSSFHHVEFRA